MTKRALKRTVREGAFDQTQFHNDDGGKVLNAPPIFADIEAGFGGPTQTFTLTRELIRAGVGGDEAVHCVLDVMSAKAPYTTLSRTMHIHPTVSELIPTVLQEMSPLD